MVDIKVVHKETVRRFVLPSNASWIDLEGKLRTLFNIPTLTPFTLSYTDEDNDVITLSTDIELHEIFASHKNIKFNLKFSISDDSSDSEDNSDVWVLEGVSRASPATIIETDISGLQNNVSQKNIISTTNQEPQYIENDDETSNQKTKVDDDFERVENSSNDAEKVETLPNDVESPNDVEQVEKSQTNVERVEESPDVERIEESPDVERVEESPNDVERVEKSPSVIERVEKSPSVVERVEKSLNDVDKVERLSTDLFVERSSADLFIERKSTDFDRVEEVDKVENSSNKKISRVNLLDDEFFESFNSFKISPTIAPFEPKPIPQPQPQLEVEDEQENEESIGTLSSSNFSPFSERIQPQRRRQEDQNTDIEELKEIIGQYAKKDPQLTASVMDEMRSSILVDHVDHERLDPLRRPIQPKEDKRNTYFRQHPIASPISGRSRSATPPRIGYNRSSTPPRTGFNGYNRSSTPEYNRSPTPDYIRSSTPPNLPGSFPVPAATPCLWVEESRPDTNQKNGRGRKNRRGTYKYSRPRRNQRNPEQSTNVEEETPDREETSEQKENNPYREDINALKEMGFKVSEERFVELLTHFNGEVDRVIEVLCEST